MKRPEIIKYLKDKGVDFNPTLKLADLESLYAIHSTGDQSVGGTNNPPAPIEGKTTGETSTEKSDTAKMLEMLGGITQKLGTMEERLKKVEGPDANAFKTGATSVDIDSAASQKASIDPKVVAIVEEVLGIDFGVELESFTDKPGLLFTVIVPHRLSDMPPSTRPVLDIDGKYKVQTDGKTPVLEDYIPQDRRSRAIGSTQSYEAIREHCTRVRSYLVSYYQKMSKPLPEFKIKQ